MGKSESRWGRLPGFQNFKGNMKITADEIKKLREETDCSLNEAHQILYKEKLLNMALEANSIDSLRQVVMQIIIRL